MPGSSQSERQRKQRLDRYRLSSSKRGYTADWRRIRKAKLEANPLCECDDCKAGKLRVTPADVVDHIISIEERPDLRLEWSNLSSMHHDCHNARTARDHGFNRGKANGPRVIRSGCDAKGRPIGDHPWNR